MAKLIDFKWTQEKKDKVIDMLEDWVIEYRATCGEVIMQSDDCTIYASELIADIMDDIVHLELTEEEVDKLHGF